MTEAELKRQVQADTCSLRFPFETTLAYADEGLSPWHRGRKTYAIWMLELNAKWLDERVARARQHLAPWLVARYERVPHITVAIAGFLGSYRMADDDADPVALARLIQSLKAEPPPTVELEIGGLNSYRSVAFLEVRDCGARLARVREQVRAGDDFREGPYEPHLTLGHYQHAISANDLAHRFSEFDDIMPRRYVARALCLATYEASDFAGPLTLATRIVLPSTE
jgi:hypothetical protein